MKKIKTVFAVIIMLSVIMSLCGCDLFTVDTDELLSPPKLTGEMYPIEKALRKAAGTDYTLRYPFVGEGRSAITLRDVDGDGVNEAFAFYSTAEEDTVMMHLNVIKKKGDNWKSVEDVVVNAGDVHKVEFSDLDGDGKQEIVVGWEIYGSSERRIGIYKLTKKGISERMFQKYTEFMCCDLDGKSGDELFVLYAGTAEEENKAGVYRLLSDGVTQIAGCLTDGLTKDVEKITLTALPDGTPALFIDETKGAGSVTEVLFMKDGELQNPLLQTETLENAATVRYLVLSSKDVDSDGVLEIPISAVLPSADEQSEKLYYTNWCSFDGEQLAVKQVMIINSADNYYLLPPERYIGAIAISRDSEKHTRTVYEYDTETQTVGSKLFTVYTLTANKFAKFKKQNKTAFKLYKNETTVFAAVIHNTDAVSQADVTAAFGTLD